MPKPSADAGARLTALVGDDPRVEIRKMFGYPAGFVNGNLCVGTFGSQFFVRLSEADVPTAARIPGARPFEPMAGRPMRQYIVLPDSILDSPKLSSKWLERSIAYVTTLPAKPGPRRR